MINVFKIRVIKLIFITLIISTFYACSGIKTETKRKDIEDVIYLPRQHAERAISKRGGQSFLKDLFVGRADNNSNLKGSQLSVNPHLWQASLEILSSTMPLASVDSSSGIIVSDWYNIKGKQNERIKISVLINSQELRADGVKVSIFKQILRANSWSNASINPKIITNIERKIIQKAGVLASTSN